VTVVRVGPGVVRLGVEAPQNMTILREEIKDDAKSPAVHPGPGSGPV
jgi:carbon storage regulator CsrA